MGVDASESWAYLAGMGWRWSLGGLAMTVAVACVADDASEDTDAAGSTGVELPSTGPSTSASASTSSGPVGSTGMTATVSSGGEASEGSTAGESSTGPGVRTAPVFFAAGDVGRTTFSCDRGQSWTGNRSYDLEGDPLVCGEVQPVTCYDDASGCQLLNGENCEQQAIDCDCDHHPGAVQGIAHGDGWWVASWGWGPPGSVRRSQDGVTWESVVEGTAFGGLAYGNGTFLAGDRQPLVSSDGGATWTEAAAADFQAANGETISNVRQVAFAQAVGGHFVAIATSADNLDIMLSSDEGASWWRPEQRPEACLQNNQGILSSPETIVLLGADGDVCTSVDGGQSWYIGAEFAAGGPGVWDGTRFRTWNGGTAYTSDDGLSWTAEPMVPELSLGTVAVDPSTGAMVAVRGGWQNWYERQEFYRSDDGVNWTVLDGAAFEGSHRIRHIAFAEAQTGACAD